jgi:hypothetical protein
MKPHQAAAIRRLLATVNQTNVLEQFDQILPLVDDRVIRRGRASKNAVLDRLLSVAATKAFGKPTRVPPQWYFELRGLWHVVIPLGWCDVWVLYDEVDERGLASFARPGVPLNEWFFVLSRAELPDGTRVLA